MSLLDVSGFESVKITDAKVEMTLGQIAATKQLIRSEGRGYSLQANKYDVNKPYRVSVNYGNVWENFGDYADVNVAAAIGSIVSRGYFGKISKIGNFDATIAEASPVYQEFLTDSRNADIIARAKGEILCIHDERAAASAQQAA
jgi:Neuraminidase (sialidase)